MKNIVRSSLFAIVIMAVAACGGGGGGGGGGGSPVTTEANVLAVTVEDIPSSAAYTVNMPYVSVTICQPGSATNCLVIDHVLVDTASVGLRILASALGSSPALPAQTDTAGDAVLECAVFASGYTWGSVRIADVQLGGLTASSLPIQIVADPAAPAVPDACSSRGADRPMDTVSSLGANGILGVGPFIDDLGGYYTCPAGTCGKISLSVSRQVINPVAALSSDNNGVILDMPSVPATGAATATGSLILGIGTRGNNALGSASVFDLNLAGEMETSYGGSAIPAFFDSGSNGLFFPDGTITPCAPDSHAPEFFCPATTQSLSATIIAATNGMQLPTAFDLANAVALVDTGNKAFSNLGAPWTGSATFDWGMPFFYGRRVYFAIYRGSAPGGTPPYVAF